MTQLYVYIDETGDLGSNYKNPGTSQHFGMAAVVMDDSASKAARELIGDLKQELNVPAGKDFSWKQHVRDHERRKYVSQRLAALNGIEVIYVYVDKGEVKNLGSQSRGYLYNFVAEEIFKNILTTIDLKHSSSVSAKIRFSHVKGFDHQKVTMPLLTSCLENFSVNSCISEISWVSPQKYKESNIADLFAGCLFAALKKDKYGNTENAYLNNIWQLVSNSEQYSFQDVFKSVPLDFVPVSFLRKVRR